MSSVRSGPAFALLVGIAAVSFAAILIRKCTLPPLTISAWRLTIATAFFLVLGLARGVPWKALRGADLRLAMAAGLFLALHFATWITSLTYTSVASSVVLVATNPLWVAVGGALFLKERAGRSTWTGIVLALIGSAIVGMASENAGTSRGMLGDVLALAGAVCGAGYFLIGRTLRARVDLIEYVSVVYGVAAAILWGMALAAGSPLWGFSADDWMLLIAIAAIPQVVGHSLLNWALRFLPSTQVSLAILGEPVGAAILAWWLLNEPVHALQGVGCVFILVGVGIATVRAGEKKEDAPDLAGTSS